MTTSDNGPAGGKWVEIIVDGPYLVHGDVPLVRKTQVVSEYGEPLTWQKTGVIATDPGEYELCRCGESGNKPFCDGSHCLAFFDGTETADEGVFADREMTFRGATRIVVKKDPTLCMNSGFCGIARATRTPLWRPRRIRRCVRWSSPWSSAALPAR